MMLSRFKSLTVPVALEIAVVLSVALLLVGCSAIARTGGSGVVVSRTAQIRSSTAVVAADLLEVNRGDSVDILDSIDIPDPSDNSKRERWYRVRGHDDERTEGWIEARNLDRKSTRLNSSHRCISYAVFCLKKKKKNK